MSEKKRGPKIKSYRDRIHKLNLYAKGSRIEQLGGEKELIKLITIEYKLK